MVEFWIKTTSWMFKRKVAQQTHYEATMYLSEDYLRSLQIARNFKIYYLVVP